MNSSRVNITGLKDFLNIADKYPGILNLPSFSLIRDATRALKSKKPCARCNNSEKTIDLREKMIAGLSVLSDNEKRVIKGYLQTDTVCFVKDSHSKKPTLICF